MQFEPKPKPKLGTKSCPRASWQSNTKKTTTKTKTLTAALTTTPSQTRSFGLGLCCCWGPSPGRSKSIFSASYQVRFLCRFRFWPPAPTNRTKRTRNHQTKPHNKLQLSANSNPEEGNSNLHLFIGILYSNYLCNLLHCALELYTTTRPTRRCLQS